MTKFEIAKNYMEATLGQSEAEGQLNSALCLLGSDNEVLSVSEIISNAYATLVTDLLGEKNFDWLMWWMWEADFGQNPDMLFWVNDVKYDASGLTFKEFWMKATGV